MQTTFTSDFIMQNRGCYSPVRVASLFPNKNYTLSELLALDFPLKDKFWFVCKKLATKEENQQIAISVAEIVLPLYEAKYPTDTRVRECIESAKKFIAGHIGLDELIAKRRAAAAYAAYAGAAAAYAGAAAAAYAGAAAAYAYAAYAGAAAAYAGAAAKQQLLNVIIKYA